MSKSLIAILLVSAFPLVSNATVTIQVRSGNFANASGIATNDMPYAIVVDTAGDGFSPGFYNAFDISSVDANGGLFLQVGGVETDDWYTFGSSLNSTAGGPPPSFLSGYADDVSDVRVSADGAPSSPAEPTDSFAIIWFPDSDASNAGDSYGFYQDAGLVLPSNSGAVNFSLFVGNSIKTADQTISAVPEPQTYAMLLGLSALVLVRMRRRSK